MSTTVEATIDTEAAFRPMWGFGMAPVKSATNARRKVWASQVLSIVEHPDRRPAPIPDLLTAVSEVKGLFNRSVRMDQWDWFTVWMQLGRPGPRRQAAPAADALAALRNALKEGNAAGVENAALMFRRNGGARALASFLAEEPPPHEKGLGYVYLLSRRDDPRHLRIGYTDEDLVTHVEVVNSADPKDPYGVRGVWLVRATLSTGRLVADALVRHQVFPDRPIYRMDFSSAVRTITAVVHDREVKSGSVTAESRFTGDGHLSPPELPEIAHPEKRAAEARHSTVQRVETDWSAYGLSDEERRVWRAAGIPVDRAHWAAMCRDSQRRPNPVVRVTPDRLTRPIGRSEESVLDALVNGQNLVRIQARMATAAGLDHVPGVPAELVALMAEKSSVSVDRAAAIARTLREEMSAGSGPSRLPRLAALIVELEDAVGPLWDARLRLVREIATYRKTGTAGELLSAFARAHGVYGRGPWLDQLTEGYAGTVAEMEHAVSSTALLGRAARSGNFLYLAPDAVAATSGYRNASEEFRDLTQSPYPVDPRGLALIAATDDLDNETLPARFLAWELDGERINATLVTRSRLANAMVKKTSSIGIIESWHRRDGLDEVDGAVRHVRLLNDLAREAHQRARTAAPTTTPPRRPRTQADRDSVLVYRSAQPASGDSEGADGKRKAPDHRWKVRGHYRQQWYPSENTHRIIWIDEHTSGPADRPLIAVDHVRVVV